MKVWSYRVFQWPILPDGALGIACSWCYTRTIGKAREQAQMASRNNHCARIFTTRSNPKALPKAFIAEYRNGELVENHEDRLSVNGDG